MRVGPATWPPAEAAHRIGAVGHLLRRLSLAAMLLLPAACGDDGRSDMPAAPAAAGRVITVDLWTGAGAGAPGVSIRGPLELADPTAGIPVQVYERVSRGGKRRQLLAATQDGAGLGRVFDQTAGQPEKHFTGDVVFPLGLWHPDESRQFEATEVTLLGPAARRITLRILELDYIYRGSPHSLRYRLTVEDAAGRVLSCEHAVYSPGKGRVAFRARSQFDGCTACPCPG